MNNMGNDNNIPNSQNSLYYQCFPNTASTQYMTGITFSLDGSTLDPAIMNIANYQLTANCSNSYWCNPITSTLVANNLLRSAKYSLSSTELQSEPVICDYGYTWSDGTSTTTSKSAVCKYPGTWILPTATCVIKPNYCSSPPALSQASYGTLNRTLYGVTYYTCDPGYSSTGGALNPYITCNALDSNGGYFSSVFYNCNNKIEPYCDPNTAPTLANANTPLPVTTVGDTTYFTCNLGYQTSGGSSPYYSCTANTATNGQWSGPTYTCNAKPSYCTSASVPTLANAQITATSAPIGTVLSYSCNNGYTSSIGTNPYVTCVAYNSSQGSWANIIGACYPTPGFCSLSTAPASLSNAVAPTPDQQVYDYSNFTCYLGYQSSIAPTSPQYQCQSSGSFSATSGSCVAMSSYCTTASSGPAPTLTNAYTPTPMQTVNTPTYFNCTPGYQSTGGSTKPYYTCWPSSSTAGMWSPVTYECTLIRNYCPLTSPSPPTLANANTPTPSQTLGENTYFLCNVGYQSTGATNPYYTCSTGTPSVGSWSAVVYSCAKITSYCQTSTIPPLANAAVGATSLEVFGLTNYTCSFGYVSSGSPLQPYTECLQDTSSYGMWSAITYSCTLMTYYCPGGLSQPPNTLNTSYAQSLGSVVTYTCINGYYGDPAAGAPTYTCGPGTAAVGSWSALTGTCIANPYYCDGSPNENTANTAAPSTFSRKLGASVVLTCQNGYSSTGSGQTVVYCLDNGLASGKWSTATISCTAFINYCDTNPQANTANSQAPSSVGTTIGSSVSLTCVSGYQQSGGSLVVTCLDNGASSGKWSTAAGTCSLVTTVTPFIQSTWGRLLLVAAAVLLFLVLCGMIAYVVVNEIRLANARKRAEQSAARKDSRGDSARPESSTPPLSARNFVSLQQTFR